MKIINSIIGILIITFGSLLLGITIHNEAVRTIIYRIIGGLFIYLGVLYLRKYAKWGD